MSTVNGTVMAWVIFSLMRRSSFRPFFDVVSRAEKRSVFVRVNTSPALYEKIKGLRQKLYGGGFCET
jgi:hypothetical protein